MLDGIHHAGGRLESLVPAFLPDLRHRQQHSAETGASIAVISGEIRATEIWSPIRRQKSREWPAALSADCRYCSLVSRIHIRPFIPIHFHRNEMIVDDARNLRILIGLPIHHVTPVTPYSTDIEKNRFVLRLCPRERSFSPRLPVHRLMPRRS